MHVDAIKPPLKVPGTKHLKLKHGEPLSSHAFKFILRHYHKATALEETNQWNKRGGGWFAKLTAGVTTDAKGLDLASQLDTALSKTLAELEAKANSLFTSQKARDEANVGPCRLTASKAVLKAPMVTALETII